jgi:hypothetical protein
MDHPDPLETRMFYELMQAYRHCPADQLMVGDAFEAVKLFVRVHVAEIATADAHRT